MWTKPLLQSLTMGTSCLLFVSCDSMVPLSDPNTSKADQRLTGVWRIRDKTGEVYDCRFAHAGGELPASFMRVEGSTRKPDGTTKKFNPFLLFPTTIGEKSYLNVPVGEDEQMKALEEKGWTPETVLFYFLLRYQVVGDTLTIQCVDGGAKKRAIQTGKIKGESFDPEFVFTDTTENLAKFVTEAGDDLFSKHMLRLERVK